MIPPNLTPDDVARVVAVAQDYDYANRPATREWRRVGDRQAGRIITGALLALAAEAGTTPDGPEPGEDGTAGPPATDQTPGPGLAPADAQRLFDDWSRERFADVIKAETDKVLAANLAAIEEAARAGERERIRQVAIDTGAVTMSRTGRMLPFEELLRRSPGESAKALAEYCASAAFTEARTPRPPALAPSLCLDCLDEPAMPGSEFGDDCGSRRAARGAGGSFGGLL
jgi:hypothetical protein